jgi:hypothetical protein
VEQLVQRWDAIHAQSKSVMMAAPGTLELAKLHKD